MWKTFYVHQFFGKSFSTPLIKDYVNVYSQVTNWNVSDLEYQLLVFTNRLVAYLLHTFISKWLHHCDFLLKIDNNFNQACLMWIYGVIEKGVHDFDW